MACVHGPSPSNRTVGRAVGALREGGCSGAGIEGVPGGAALDRARGAGERAGTGDPALIARSDAIEVVFEATGHVEYGAAVTLDCLAQGKDIVSLNVELDATVGPLLRHRAAAAGTIFSGADGDQPGVTMNLVRHELGRASCRERVWQYV